MYLVNYLLPKIEHFQFLGYWVVLLISLLESLAFVGIVVPGSSFIIFIGALSARGYWDLAGLIWFAAVGAIAGDGISYYLGRKGKILFAEENRIFRKEYLEKGESFFKRHGAKSLLLGRFIGPIRAVIPFIAGLSRMKPKRFYFWNVVSAILWACANLLLGYFFGHAWNAVEVWAGRVGIFLAIIALFIICAYFIEKFLLTKGQQLLQIAASAAKNYLREISAKPGVQSFAGRHPLFFSALKDRLRTRKFSGLPLSMLFVAFLFVLLALLGVTEDIVNQDAIVSFDSRFASLVYVYRSSLLVEFFLWITLLCNMEVVLRFALAFSLLLWIWGKRSCVLSLWISLGGSYVFFYFGKIAIQRQRPAEFAVYDESLFSFPSGHATLSVAFYGLIAYFLIRHINTWRSRLNLSFAAIILIAAIGFSRLYLGVHFLSDVIGGYLLGLLWLIIGICLSEMLPEEKKGISKGSTSPAIRKISTALILLVAAGFYVFSGLTYHPVKHASPEKPGSGIVVGNVVTGFSNNGLPRYTESITGETRRPLNLAFLSNNDEVIVQALQKAGWRVADPPDFGSVGKLIRSMLHGKSYPSAPMSPAFWNNRVNDMSFEKPSPSDKPGNRYEVRIWTTNLRDAEGEKVYAGLVSLTEGFEWLAVPKTDPDIDSARKVLESDLRKTGRVISGSREPFVNTVSRRGSGRDSFFTDGTIHVIDVR